MNSNDIIGKITIGREKIKTKKPLIHHITNYVTATDSANISLSIGASPVMVDNSREIEEIIQVANALVLNIGTLQFGQEGVYIKAVEIANKNNLPVILDPVGVGAITIRRRLVIKLLDDYKVSIIKGNLAEIKSILNIPTKVKGVDSEDTQGNSIKAAVKLAREYGTIVAVTGKKDIVTDGRSLVEINNGHSLLSVVTGTGCMTATLIGTFCATGMDKLCAAVGGVLSMGIAGELAAKRSAGPGTLHYNLMDEIYNIDSDKYNNLSKISYSYF